MIVINGASLSRFSLTPSDTSLNTLYTQAVQKVLLLSLTLTPLGSASATVEITGSSSFNLVKTRALTIAGGPVIMQWRDGIPINTDDLIKVQSSVNSLITFQIVIAELMR